MESLTKGSVVLIPFPFSDLSNAKVRPAIVVAVSDMSDFILCQITSNSYADKKAIKLADADFTEGSLQRVSFVTIQIIYSQSKPHHQASRLLITKENRQNYCFNHSLA